MRNMKKSLAFLLVLVMLLAACQPTAVAPEKEATDTATEAAATEATATEAASTEGTAPVSGTYQGEGAGKYGPFKVDVTLTDSAITDIKVTESQESGFTAPVIAEMIGDMIATNSADVDAVTGATLTSFALRNAVNKAIEAAGVTLVAHESAETEKVFEDVETDIVVVGAGGAGLSSAIEATQNGAKVIVVEKNGFMGGNTNYATGGMNAAGTPYQEAEGIEDSPELYYSDTMKGGKDMNDPELLKTLTEQSAPALEWLESIGADMKEVGRSGGQSVNRIHKGPEGMPIGTHLMDVFAKNVDELGIDVRLYTKAVEISHEGNKVTGIRVETKDGQNYAINAKAVILASGGFGANPELVEKYNPNLKGFGTTNTPGATGDALALVEPLNVALTDIEQIQTHPTVVPKVNEMITEGVRGDGAILVNRAGERFTDELLTRDVVSKAILDQEGGTAFLILDKQVFEATTTYKKYLEQGFLKEGATLADIAGIIGCDAATLEATVMTYNEGVEAKNDAVFGRTSLDVALTEAPYYTVEIAPAIHHTMGGVKIDTSAEVINTDGTPIEGLFAAGEVTGGVHGGNRIGGNAVTDIVVFGRISGKSAAEFVKGE